MLAYVPVALWSIVAIVAILMIIFGDEKFQAIVMAFASIVALIIALVVEEGTLAIVAFIGQILIVCIPAAVMLLWYFVAGKLNSDRKIKKGRNNLRALIGEKCLVVEDISNIHDKGLVKHKGAVWSARSVNENDFVEAGTIVVVKYIEGVKLICTRE
jgi:membrane protein implicated in regulation of membrane protease activity